MNPPWFLRALAIAVLSFTGGLSVLADGPIQPDPPVPLEQPAMIAAASGAARYAAARPVVREPDCRCSVLHARDMESRVEGHVELLESRSTPSTPRTRDGAVIKASYVEGVVGFPVRQFRLADAPADDGAGSD